MAFLPPRIVANINGARSTAFSLALVSHYFVDLADTHGKDGHVKAIVERNDDGNGASKGKRNG